MGGVTGFAYVETNDQGPSYKEFKKLESQYFNCITDLALPCALSQFPPFCNYLSVFATYGHNMTL